MIQEADDDSGHEPQPTPPPPPDPVRNFELLEAKIFRDSKGISRCTHCNKTDLVSKGVAGAHNSKGARRLQVLCKSCGKSFRLAPALEKAGNAGFELLKQLKTALSVLQTRRHPAPIADSNRSTAISKPTAKRLRSESAELEAGEVLEVDQAFEITTSTTNSQAPKFSSNYSKELAEACARADKAEKEKSALEAQIALLRKQVQELQSQFQQSQSNQFGSSKFTFSHGGERSGKKSVSFGLNQAAVSASTDGSSPGPWSKFTLPSFSGAGSSPVSNTSGNDKQYPPGILKKPTASPKSLSGSGVNGRHIPGWDQNVEEEEDFDFVPVRTRSQAKAAQMLKPVSTTRLSRQSAKEGGHSSSGMSTRLASSPPLGPTSFSSLTSDKVSYAHVASKQAKVILKKRQIAASKMLAPTHEPIQYTVVRIAINDSRPLRNVKGAARSKLVKEVANTLGIGKFTILASTIGNSILEFYIPVGTLDVAMERLKEANVQVLDNFDPFKLPSFGKQSAEACKASTVNRLTHLCLVAKLVNLQDAILQGAPVEVKAAVLAKVRTITRNPQATLGRQHGHSSTAVVMADDNMDETASVSSC